MSGEGLATRWRAVWPGGATDGDAVYIDLLRRYAELHRAYHTLDHIAACLGWLDETRTLAVRPGEVELALWFHDAVYDPRRTDNEEQSAHLAETTLRGSGVDEGVTDRVSQLIRLTSHSHMSLSGDVALLCDIDLAILGSSPPEFDAYDAAIRHEYAWVPAAVFARERARLLAAFLARPRIYFTDYFHDLLELPARQNLTRTTLRYGQSLNSPANSGP